MILLIDNYDSFVYNLSRYLVEMGCRTQVVRNDQISIAEIRSLNPQAIVISPGPCTPQEAGISRQVVRELGQHIPILGVCLGHQAIADALGGQVVRASQPVHGRTSSISHRGTPLFEGHSNPFPATRYHSLIVPKESLPSSLQATAHTTDGLLMAIEHRHWPVFGVQFHPESVLTEGGHRLLYNFLKLAGVKAIDCPQPELLPPPSPPDDWPAPPAACLLKYHIKLNDFSEKSSRNESTQIPE